MCHHSAIIARSASRATGISSRDEGNLRAAAATFEPRPARTQPSSKAYCLSSIPRCSGELPQRPGSFTLAAGNGEWQSLVSGHHRSATTRSGGGHAARNQGPNRYKVSESQGEHHRGPRARFRCFVAGSAAAIRPAVDRADLVELVLAARKGDGTAWNALISRYTPLIDSITRRYRLSPSDAEDVSQLVWLRLFDNLNRLRETRALPGWISTTTRNEAVRLLTSGRRVRPMDPTVLVMLDVRCADDGTGPDMELLRAERDRAILDGLAELSPGHRNLLILLHAEPRTSYQEISRALGIPTGSIGPTRARCLNKLKNTRAVKKYLRSERASERPGGGVTAAGTSASGGPNR